MRRAALAFLAGILLFLSQQQLPSLFTITALLAGLGIVCLFRYFWLCALPAGFFWAWLFAHSLLVSDLPSALEGKPLTAMGRIVSIPEARPFGTRFRFAMRTLAGQPFSGTALITWPHPPTPLRAGERWQLTVRLKRIHGVMNPGGTDLETLRFAEGISATGTVLATSQNARQAEAAWYSDPLDQIRQTLKQKIEARLPQSATAHWLLALSVGERDNIPAAEWEVLRRTGTNHLMAIAGLHLGFVAGGVFFLVERLWRLSARLCGKIPARLLAGWVALLAGVAYGALSGFLLPARRASAMLCLGMLGLLARRKLPAWQAWSLALWAVLLMQPLSVLTTGFWLSFGSVALILYGMSGRVARGGLWWKTGRVQWVTALGLMPLSVWLFQQYSLVSFLANAVSIPWTGCVLLPLVFGGCISLGMSDTLSQGFFWLADQALAFMWQVLTALSQLSFAAYPVVVAEPWRMALMLGGVLVLLLPAGFRGRWMGIFWWLPVFFFTPSAPLPGTAWVTLLDVGQGLSVVVQTRQHVLVFDAGPRVGLNGYDAGAAIVTPYLRYQGIRQIDTLVVSHGDSDHAGGVSALLAAFPVRTLLTSVPERMPVPATVCQQGVHWEWDGVRFAFLYPDVDDLQAGNDSSCVLKVSTPNAQSVLLTGDIEKNAEKKLLLTDQNLRASVIVVPHHGSKTSSDRAFVQAVHPAWALFPLGYRNRYHFPHPAVVERYREAGAICLETDKTGAIHLALGERVIHPHLFRQQHRHFWNR